MENITEHHPLPSTTSDYKTFFPIYHISWDSYSSTHPRTVQQCLGAGSLEDWVWVSCLRCAQWLAPTQRWLPYIHRHRRASLSARHFLHPQQLFHAPELVCYRNWVRNSHQWGCRLTHHLLFWKNPAHSTSLCHIGAKGPRTDNWPVFLCWTKIVTSSCEKWPLWGPSLNLEPFFSLPCFFEGPENDLSIRQW